MANTCISKGQGRTALFIAVGAEDVELVSGILDGHRAAPNVVVRHSLALDAYMSVRPGSLANYARVLHRSCRTLTEQRMTRPVRVAVVAKDQIGIK